MTISVIEDKCKHDGKETKVLLEGDTFDEVIGLDAKKLALATAAKMGSAVRGISGSTGAYMVNQDGEDVKTAEDMKKVKKAKFRNEYRLATMLGFPFSSGV